MLKAIVLITAFTVTPVNPVEKPPIETITITRETAEKLVQAAIAQQVIIEELKQALYQYQMALYDERNKMCA